MISISLRLPVWRRTIAETGSLTGTVLTWRDAKKPTGRTSSLLCKAISLRTNWSHHLL